ncbi:hypothetical protein EVAR_97013_1 [Eumeta japonica]|uniref:Uncharacterized protein n=1 Tax=Eumeta variegata TaxID=151549 RepID=A0A4C1WJW9_EUMVA|nr:hypothetical protein EVAR_97013_1 [Eumeta japonica]
MFMGGHDHLLFGGSHVRFLLETPIKNISYRRLRLRPGLHFIDASQTRRAHLSRRVTAPNDRKDFTAYIMQNFHTFPSIGPQISGVLAPAVVGRAGACGPSARAPARPDAVRPDVTGRSPMTKDRAVLRILLKIGCLF